MPAWVQASASTVSKPAPLDDTTNSSGQRSINSNVALDGADFNDPLAVVHYTRAAHFLGLWKSERLLIERFFPDREASLLEAGCGSGRGRAPAPCPF